MPDIYNNIDTVLAMGGTLTSTGSPSQLTSGSIDLQFYEAADVVATFLDIDELGSSPVGAATATLALDHSDDGSTWTACATADVIGATITSNGECVSTTTDFTTIHVGYRMTKRYIRCRLIATALTNGGVAVVNVLKGRKRHGANQTV